MTDQSPKTTAGPPLSGAPGSVYLPLFEHMAQNHGLTLLDSELEDICLAAEKVRESMRVPQYDRELKAASDAVKEWQEVAAELYRVMGISRREIRFQCAQNRYEAALRRYTPNKD